MTHSYIALTRQNSY